MKKGNKTRFIAVKKYFSARSEDFKAFICIFLAVFIALSMATSICTMPSNDQMIACREELTSYLSSPSRYAVNTDIYTLKISDEGTMLSINNSLASCKAVFDVATNNFNYTSYRSIFVTILFWICITFVFGIAFFFAFDFIISLIGDIYKWISKHCKEFRKEYLLNKAEAELNITHEEAEKYELSIQHKEEFDRAYKKGFDAGYTDGRSKGFKQGQNDAYEEGYAKGYTDGQNEVADAIDSFMNDEDKSCDCEDNEPDEKD